MFIKAILSVIATLGIMYWLFRRRHIHYPTMTGEDSEAKGDQGENKDEADDTQAALHGLLERIRALNLTLISINTGGPSTQDSDKEE